MTAVAVVLEARGLVKHFKDVKAVDGVDFRRADWSFRGRE
jgi:ABC-type sugar transport system ATPase subunit